MDPESCNNINQLWATLLIEELVRNGITRFVLSPGSRSTPLTTAVAQHPKTNNTVHYDERGAAFYALGHAKATGNPTALLCTSGTATANYLPAIIEASESRIPLIVLTADRPPELLDCEANQAIDQQDLYKNYTRWATTLPCPDPAIDPAVLLTTVDQAVYRAQRAPRGPVHLNCMFREPLAPTPDASIPNAYCDTLTQWTNTDAPYTQYHLPKVSLFTEEQGAFIQTITNAQRGWLVVGELTSEAETEAAQALANALQWPVFPEVTSGLRLTTGAPAPVLHYDAILRNFDSDDRPTPDLVLHIGGPLVSKELPAFISSHRPQYLLVNDHPRRQDPNHNITQRIEADLTTFCNWLAASIGHGDRDPQTTTLVDAAETASHAIDNYLETENELSEPYVARTVSKHRPENSALFLGNSMIIRDMAAFGAATDAPLRVAANRGASGIDGNIATAAAYAKGTGLPTTALVGDLAALHDLNSLPLLHDLTTSFVLIVVNNDGGGIFSFLPVATAFEQFEPYFGTPHGLNFENAATLFGIIYKHPASTEEFLHAYQSAFDDPKVTLIEVQTDRTQNLETHQALSETIASALQTTTTA